MGGPMSVYDHGRLSHLMQEMRLMESALKSGRPVLGVCLGSQLLAHVLGARVYPGRQKEIGWHSVSVSKIAAVRRQPGGIAAGRRSAPFAIDENWSEYLWRLVATRCEHCRGNILKRPNATRIHDEEQE
jgi:gamma-glutamyl-gamma-aminobutyrate hydrolase PuuD